MNKNIYYPEGFQEKVDTLMRRLSAQGVDLLNPKSGTLSESALFRYLVDQKLAEIEDAEESEES